MVTIQRAALSGIGPYKSLYDDNLIRVVATVAEGPKAILGRQINIEMSIDDFVTSLPVEVAARIQQHFHEMSHE